MNKSLTNTKLEFTLVFIAVATLACLSSIFVESILPPTDPACFKPGYLCEPSPFPLFTGLGSVCGGLLLYLKIKDIIAQKFKIGVEDE